MAVTVNCTRSSGMRIDVDVPDAATDHAGSRVGERPQNGGPGVYNVKVEAANPSASTLYQFMAAEAISRTTLARSLGPDHFTDFELTDGVWTVTASVRDGPDCPASVCTQLQIDVNCIEEPDRVVMW